MTVQKHGALSGAVRRRRRTTAIVDHAVAGAWGYAEATVFFIVPDFYTSWVALHDTKRGLAATVSALAGAVAGGVTTYAVARNADAAMTRRVLLAVPGINEAMVDRVANELDNKGVLAMLIGPTKGTPYKIYARFLGHSEYPVGKFLGYTIPARLPRFLLVTGAVGLLGRLGDKLGASKNLKRGVFFTGWAAFYTWYFGFGPGNKNFGTKRPHSS